MRRQSAPEKVGGSVRTGPCRTISGRMTGHPPMTLLLRPSYQVKNQFGTSASGQTPISVVFDSQSGTEFFSPHRPFLWSSRSFVSSPSSTSCLDSEHLAFCTDFTTSWNSLVFHSRCNTFASPQLL